MKIFSQLTSNNTTTEKSDSTAFSVHPNNSNMLIIRRPNSNNVRKKSDPLKDFMPGTKDVEEVFGGKKVTIRTTTTVDKVNNGDTIITIVEESKYHIATKKRTIHIDGSQELQSESKNKVKTCKMPPGFAQKYLSSYASMGKI